MWHNINVRSSTCIGPVMCTTLFEERDIASTPPEFLQCDNWSSCEEWCLSKVDQNLQKNKILRPLWDESRGQKSISFYKYILVSCYNDNDLSENLCKKYPLKSAENFH